MRHHCARKGKISVILFTLLVACSAVGTASEIRLAVQPIIDQQSTRDAYQPLADYLRDATGSTVTLKTAYDYADYWLRMKEATHYDLVLDAPFYVDYRIRHQGHVPLVKIPGLVSYSLVALSSAVVFDASELIGKKIASLTPPAPGGLVMARMFPNPSRQPYIVPVRSSEEALALLLAGKVHAAMIPTPMAAQAMSQGQDIATVVTTPQTPHMTLTAGPALDDATRAQIRAALLNAPNLPEGREMLRKIGFEAFEPAAAELYYGYSEYLEQGW